MNSPTLMKFTIILIKTVTFCFGTSASVQESPLVVLRGTYAAEDQIVFAPHKESILSPVQSSLLPHFISERTCPRYNLVAFTLPEIHYSSATTKGNSENQVWQRWGLKVKFDKSLRISHISHMTFHKEEIQMAKWFMLLNTSQHQSSGKRKLTSHATPLISPDWLHIATPLHHWTGKKCNGITARSKEGMESWGPMCLVRGVYHTETADSRKDSSNESSPKLGTIQMSVSYRKAK